MPRAQPTRDYHPSTRKRAPAPAGRAGRVEIPPHVNDVEVAVGDRTVRLTNLTKVFWADEGITKGDLLRYYAELAPALLPHIRDRAMVMKRYPNGAAGDFFFMKRAPTPRPDWIETCSIEHSSGNVIDFPVINDFASLLWVVNLGCIDLNEWYARCDDVDRPDYLHFDLDPGEQVRWPQVVETAHVVNATLRDLGMPTYVKTTGSRGLHVYVPIVRGPTQKTVWTVAKTIATDIARRHPRLATAIYRKEARPCTSTSTRTPGATRSRPSTPSARGRALPSRRPSPGTSSPPASPSTTSAWITSPPASVPSETSGLPSRPALAAAASISLPSPASLAPLWAAGGRSGQRGGPVRPRKSTTGCACPGTTQPGRVRRLALNHGSHEPAPLPGPATRSNVATRSHDRSGHDSISVRLPSAPF
jgi:bifunctional non-homologous end joining protein LigD